jgi:hypothetical protein
MFIAASFTIAKLRKQQRCPTTDEWIRKMCSLYAMEFYSAMKKNDILSLAGKWMELEISRSEKLTSFRRPNNVYFLSYVEYRINKNAAIL